MENSNTNSYVPGLPPTHLNFDEKNITALDDNCNVIKTFKKNSKKILQLGGDGILYRINSSSKASPNLANIIETISQTFELKDHEFSTRIRLYNKCYISTNDSETSP